MSCDLKKIGFQIWSPQPVPTSSSQDGYLINFDFTRICVRGKQVFWNQMFFTSICYKFVKRFSRVAVLGSWNSVLLKELLESRTSVEHWDFYDTDHNCHRDRDLYHESNGLQRNYTCIEDDVPTLFAHEDVHKQYDLIINPSCVPPATVSDVLTKMTRINLFWFLMINPLDGRNTKKTKKQKLLIFL